MTAPTIEDPTADDTAPDDASGNTGGMVALIPTDPYPLVLAVPGGLPPDQLHLTLAYLGDNVTDWDPELGVAVRQVVREITGAGVIDDDMPVPAEGPGTQGPLTLTVFSHAHFNPTGADGREPCMVYQFSGDGDLPMVEALASEVQFRIKDAIGEVNFPEQHERFEPHVTAGYGLAPDALTYVGPVVFDRIRVALGDNTTDIPLRGDNTVTAAAPAATDAPVVVSDTGTEIRVHWDALAVEGLDTGDGRYLTPGGGSTRTPPLSLLALPYSPHGGADAPAAEVFGEITQFTRRPGPEVTSKRTGEPFPEGTFVWGADATIDGTHKFADMVRKGYLRGGSVDLSDLDAELIDDETAAMSGNPRRRAVLTRYEIAAATMVPVPAFADAYCDVVDTLPVALAASALPAGMATVPVPMWRAVELGNFAAHPGSVIPSAQDKTAGTSHWSLNDLETEAMIAAITSCHPPLAYFTDPGLAAETPVVIEDPDPDGYRRTYGHLAAWSRAHIGFNGRKVYAPHSKSDYSFFNTGAVRCSDTNGDTRIAAVGHLTMDTGHADLGYSTTTATRHYDHTGFAWADVAVGEDAHGVWFNGICKPGITAEQIAYAYAHPPSGDWRPLDGGHELVAALCVNTPGLPVFRARVASGQILAMVAAGALPPERSRSGDMLGSTHFTDQFADIVADRVLVRQAHAAALVARRTAALAATNDGPDRMAAALAAVPDDDADFTLSPADVAGFAISTMPPQLRESYLHGKAAAHIGWGTDGDYLRCIVESVKHGIPGRMRPGMCATLHKEATGKVPGKH